MANGFGTAKIEREYEGYKIFKLKSPKPPETETELVLRLLPPMKSYADSHEWKFFYGQHYGYSGNNARNPDKPRARPFGCIQKKEKGVIVTTCPKCEQIDSARQKYEARDKALEAQGMEKAERKVDKALKTLGDWLMRHNCDKKFMMNVMSKAGGFGVLQLSYTTTMERLIPVLKELAADGIDAFDLENGVYLRLTRTGAGFNVVDDIKPLQATVEVNGKRLKEIVTAPMSEEQQEKALKTCPDLAKDVVKFLSREKVEQLVACNGDPDAVDAIWGDAKPEAKTETKAAAPKTALPAIEVEETEEAPAPVAKATKASAAPTPSAEDDEEAALEAKLAAARARKASKAAPVAAAAELDPSDDFLSRFEEAK